MCMLGLGIKFSTNFKNATFVFLELNVRFLGREVGGVVPLLVGNFALN